MLQAQAGIRLQLVQYKGAGPALIGMLGNEVQVYFDAAATVLQHIQSGKLKPLAVTGSNRLAILPQVPTLRESGLPDFDVTIWYGLLAPAGLPATVTEKMRAGVVAVLSRPDVKSQFATLGVQPFQIAGPQFDALLKADSEKYGAIIKAGGIKLE
jgi:tripartite-type tricarboxylate transporter receptor subunit TctC